MTRRSSRRHRVSPTLALALVVLAGAACAGGADGDRDSGVAPTADATPSSAGSDAANGEAAPADPSGEWWYATFGDPSVLAAESQIGVTLNRTEARDGYQAGWTAEASFASRGGEASLKVEAGWPEGADEETIELSSEEYLELWKKAVETGFVADAMAGNQGDGFGSGTEAYLTGSAGPDGLGWTVSASREAFESFPSSRRLMELLIDEAASRSEVFRRGLELVNGE